ncbi:MAG: hypothetical protein J0H74_10860 [Chitinophagaceae bacterium]|nr:hypothetical protein [Chitinophagaceae bacterium]
MPNDPEISPPRYLTDIVETAMGKKSTRWTAPDCGLSSAHRFSVQLEDNSKVFVKAATDKETGQWLRREHFVLSSMRLGFMPYVIAWIDTPGIHPVLISQDLSHAYWPASHSGVVWRDGDIDLLFSGIKKLSLQTAPPDLPALYNRKVSIWSQIAVDPEGFLHLDLCSEAWFGRSIDALIKAERDADVTGNCLVHGDIRSDNVCFVDSKVVFVDWSHAAKGNGLHNLATIVPTLYLEGGPAPYMIMPDGGGEAATGCADHIQRLAVDRGMPVWLKRVFKQIIAIELEWAAQCLKLDEPDGARWRDI